VSLAWRELVRRPGRFAVAGSALTLLVVLLFLLGGLLDGLFLGSTGAIRAQQADAFVFSSDAQSSFLRSRIGPDVRARIEGLVDVEAVDGLGFTLLGARRAADPDAELLDVAVAGYEGGLRDRPAPPAAGQAWADERLRDDGVAVGDVLALGPAGVPVEVAGFVADTSYLLQGALWVEPGTWRAVQASARPDATVGEGVFQALVVRGAGDAAALTRAIDGATAGATASLTREEAVFSLPGTRQQNSTFTALIGVTLLVAGLVSALFFALLTLERTTTYAILKAIGAPSVKLVLGVVLQAVVVAAGAVALGFLLTLGLEAVIPRGIPVRFEPSRLVTSAGLVILTAAAGGLVSLRRIVRIDPATAIG
jgi:putative ABC transport system permease protein